MAVIDHEKLDDYRFLGTPQIVGADAPFDNAVAFAGNGMKAPKCAVLVHRDDLLTRRGQADG
ncbi:MULTISPECIES: hypothetical protein [Paracoccus]|uniref:hypothetical protein n=1 Tax=Paracoccus TaxID=265 RepID=UPI001AD838BE|nr:MULTISPECIES: hypothetical protein [Paracoccus]MBT0778637.1 hypothetical protein [Paracoccus sp. pheM1]